MANCVSLHLFLMNRITQTSTEICDIANCEYVETFNFFLQSELMVWLGSGTWLGLGKKLWFGLKYLL